MLEQRLDLVIRHAAPAISRRDSVTALGGASIAALVSRPNAAAGNKSRKRKQRNDRKCRKKARRLADDACQREATDCEVSFGPGSPEQRLCCALLATCDYAAFFGCLVEAD